MLNRLATHWAQTSMDAILRIGFSNAFYLMKVMVFCFKFHWSLFRKVHWTTCQQCFRERFCTKKATGHYLNRHGLVYLRINGSHGFNNFKSPLLIEQISILYMKPAFYRKLLTKLSKSYPNPLIERDRNTILPGDHQLCTLFQNNDVKLELHALIHLKTVWFVPLVTWLLTSI